MENTPTITISKEKASEIYGEYKEAVKTRKEKIYHDLKKTYYHLSKGHKVLDIFEVFKKSGVDKRGEPKLAISVAGKREVHFCKEEGGAGIFYESGEKWNKSRVRLPSNTFPQWEGGKTGRKTWDGKEIIGILRETVKTKVPIVPPYLLPTKTGKLDNYYILWETSDWQQSEDSMPKAKDPFLLIRINANAFIVLAEWDLTKVEQAIIRGK